MRFEFDDSKQTEVFADLEQREGKNFPLRKMRVKLADGRNVEAYLPVYVGKNVITGKTLDELVAMAMAAVGKDGKASDYVLNIAKKLNTAGVENCTVNAFAAAVRKAQQSDGWPVAEELLIATDSTRRVVAARRVCARDRIFG